MSKIGDIVTAIAEPVVKELGCILWDVEYVKEAGQWYLRIYIDREEGVSINDCEAVSRAMDPLLDEADPISESYIFEVSSAGLERQLKRPEHFARFMGEEIQVKLYKARDGAKLFRGKLVSYDKGAVTIAQGDGELSFEKAEIAAVHISLL